MTRRDHAANKGSHIWEGTIPLLQVPDRTAKSFGRVFARIGNGKQKWYMYAGVMPGGGVFDGEVEINYGNRAMVLRWLRSLPILPEGVATEIAGYVGEVTVRNPKVIAVGTKGRVNFGLNVLFAAPHDKATLAFMMSAVISAGYGGNIRCCPQCKKWFADFPKGRRIKTYCSQKHQNAFAQRRWQKEKSK